MKAEKSKLQLKERMKRKKLEEKNPELRIQRLKENVPKTLETLRVWDETVVANDDEEVGAEDFCLECSFSLLFFLLLDRSCIVFTDALRWPAMI